MRRTVELIFNYHLKECLRLRTAVLIIYTLLCLPKSAFSQIFIESAINYQNPGFIIDPQSGTNGIAAADYDRDGDTDLYFTVRDSAWGGDQRTWNRLFSNQGMSLTDKTQISGLTGLSLTRWSEMGYNIGASWGDFNNDGYPDIFLYYTGKDQLFKNNADGTFTDISTTAGIRGIETQLSSHGLWWDYDKDGDLDLYVTVRKDVALQNKDSKNRMYENIGDSKFLDVSETSGLNDPRFSYMSVALDINQDGDLDLYVANDFGPNSLYINMGNKTFRRDSSNTFGLNNTGESMGITIGDANSDGLFDLYITNVTNNGLDTIQTNPLFLNSEAPPLTNVARSSGVAYAGWGWGTEFFDFDNDTDEDLFVSNGYFANDNKNHLFENITDSGEQLTFNNISDSAGVADPDVSRSNVIFDYDNDGFLDLLISNFYSKPKLYLNSNTTGNWLKIELEGKETNFNGLGSVIEVEIEDRKLRKYVHGAQFFGQNILPIHFGLENFTLINKLTVFWLNGHIDEFMNIDTNQKIRVIENDGIVILSGTEQPHDLTPLNFELLGNYPNPFNGSTKIQFQLNHPAPLTLSIYDITGRKIFSGSEFFPETGRNHFSWQPGGIHSGVYLYRISRNEMLIGSGLMHYLK